MARFDFISGERQGFTAYFDNQLLLHRTKLEGADAFYDKQAGLLLTPPDKQELDDFPRLVRHEFLLDQKMDIVFSGLGWICVNANKETATKVAAWAPDGVAVVVRKAII